MSESLVNHQIAAERVRQFLVSVRGGALFLSPSDAERLTNWLENGVPETTILLAIERAAKARIKKRSKLPLTLGSASRHLGKSCSGFALSAMITQPDHNNHPLATLAEEIKNQAPSSIFSKQLLELAPKLLKIDPDIDDIVCSATALIAALFQKAINKLSTEQRQALYNQGRDQLGDLDQLVDESIYKAALEERVLGILWEAHPYLSVSTLSEQVST